MLKNYFLISFYIMLSVSLFAQSKETLNDIDGNEYNVITIGTQQWMAENLRVEHYAPARIMLHSHAGTSTGNYPKNAGLSVRCIKNLKLLKH